LDDTGRDAQEGGIVGAVSEACDDESREVRLETVGYVVEDGCYK